VKPQKYQKNFELMIGSPFKGEVNLGNQWLMPYT
jgi:hypothetical protein